MTPQKAFTPNFLQSETNFYASNLNEINSNQASVFVITQANNRASTLPLNHPDSQQEECANSLFERSSPINNHTTFNQEQKFTLEDNIVIEQNSKLGILLQTKVLEDKVISLKFLVYKCFKKIKFFFILFFLKMQSFVTLMKEKQLNKEEQVQVFDSIKTDYESLLRNYEQAKLNDPDGILPNELDMDM